MTHSLTFKCEHINGGTASIMPCIDGKTMAELVTEFEREKGHTDPAGGYGGIVPSHFNLGPLQSYFLGKEGPIDGDREGEIYALFCECGEAGCWPLIAHVRASAESVIWEDFTQPHRPKRDYKGFGPFEFARNEFQQAVADVAAFGDVG